MRAAAERAREDTPAAAAAARREVAKRVAEAVAQREAEAQRKGSFGSKILPTFPQLPIKTDKKR